MEEKIVANNKKALYEYFVLERFTAGLELMGSEIKTLRSGKASLSDAYCIFKDDELFVKSMYIAEYKQASHYTHETRRLRKLLLNRQELKKLHTKVKEKGFTIVPLALFINEKGLAKLEIALARGKKVYDKRASIKEKDLARDVDRSRY